jgi:hypothetical protein
MKAGPLTVGPITAAPTAGISNGRKERSISLINAPGELKIFELAKNHFLVFFCY